MKNHIATFLATIGALLFGQSAHTAPTCLKDSRMGKQLNLPVYEWVDRTKARQGTIVAVHGMTLYAYSWDHMARHLAARGYHVYALDQRGFGRWMHDSAQFGGTKKVEIGQSQQDLLDLVTDLRQAHKDQKLFCLGESAGSNMILSLISAHPELCDGAILASPCYKRRMHPKPLHVMKDVATHVLHPNKPIDLAPYSAAYLTNDPVLEKQCNADPLINRELSAPELIKFDVMNDKGLSAAKKLPADMPIEVIAGAQDAMFKSTELPREVEKWGTKQVTVTLSPGKGHLLIEHQHVNPQIAHLVDGWLQHHAGAALAAHPAHDQSNH